MNGVFDKNGEEIKFMDVVSDGDEMYQAVGSWQGYVFLQGEEADDGSLRPVVKMANEVALVHRYVTVRESLFEELVRLLSKLPGRWRRRS